jgi:hypothetical protein
LALLPLVPLLLVLLLLLLLLLVGMQQGVLLQEALWCWPAPAWRIQHLPMTGQQAQQHGVHSNQRD